MQDLLFTRFKRKAKNWWVGLLIGLLVMCVGFWSLSVPALTLVTLNIVFVTGFIAGGVLDISYSLAVRKDRNDWGWLMFNGIVSLILGILLASEPAMSIFILLLYVGIWMLIQSISIIMSAIRMKKVELSGWVWILVLGILTMVFSIILLSNPDVTSVFIVSLFSMSLVLYGFIRVIYAFVMLSLHRKIKKLESN